MHQLLGLCSSPEAALAVAEAFGGDAWAAHEGERAAGPYRGMFAVACDDIDALDAADVGLHLIFRRVIKQAPAQASPERVIASFGMVGHADLTHRQSDAHWRDTHGPLALRSHLAMCDYEQLSIVATLRGETLDGVAMCAFDTRDDLSKRFFNDDAAKKDIIADVSTFADTRQSLPRVVLTQTR